MGFFDPPKRPVDIRLLNVENGGSKAMINYKATYADKSSKNIRINVKYLSTYFMYSATEPHIIKAECLGKVYVGLIKSDVRLLFLVKLSDRTMDLLQAKEGTNSCNTLLAKTLEEEQRYEEPKYEEKSYSSSRDERIEENIELPIDILPNLYSVSVSNVALKHHRTYKNGKIEFDYVTLKCKINYCLNGRKEGKRKFIFTSYDDRDGVLEIRGDYDKYHFTEAGYEFVEICFDKPQLKRISISVKENS